MVESLGFRVWGLGLRVQGLGLRVYGLGFRVYPPREEGFLGTFGELRGGGAGGEDGAEGVREGFFDPRGVVDLHLG